MPTEEQLAAAAKLESDVVTAVLAAINAAVEPLPGGVEAYENGDVPKKIPPDHLVVTVARRPGGPGRAGRYATTGWAVYVLAVSSVSLSNARTTLGWVRANLLGSTLTVAGVTSTPVTFYTARQVAPDGSKFSGTDTYHFTV